MDFVCMNLEGACSFVEFLYEIIWGNKHGSI